jgi:hypothetical protein
VWLCYGTVPALVAGSGLTRMAPEFPGNTSACTPTHRGGAVILRSQHGPVPHHCQRKTTISLRSGIVNMQIRF